MNKFLFCTAKLNILGIFAVIANRRVEFWLGKQQHFAVVCWKWFARQICGDSQLVRNNKLISFDKIIDSDNN